MSQLLENLPGMEMPVDRVIHELAHMWDDLGEMGSYITDSRASQLNLVLHLGLETDATEAQELFEKCLSFAQTHPCRIIVLCPSETKIDGFMGKLFSQCYVGEQLREACCCEALMLGYSIENSDFLENQVSVWLESDLPVYHWFHRVPPERISTYYLDYLKRCKRVLFDGEIEGNQLDSMDWPHPDRVRDLAHARTLPLRQHLGQFLSNYKKDTLVDGLKTLRIQYHLGLRRTAFQLLRWHKHAIEKCFANSADAEAVSFTLEQLVQEGSSCCLKIQWEYPDSKKYLNWDYDKSQRKGSIRTNLNDVKVDHPLHIEPFDDQKVLSEALFVS